MSQRAFRENGQAGEVKVLVIDDDVKNVAALRRGLEGEGYRVEVAHDGNDGLWLATESKADLIVLEHHAPGPERVPRGRTLRKRGVWTPILM